MWAPAIFLAVGVPWAAPQAKGEVTPRERYENLVQIYKLLEDKWKEKYQPGGARTPADQAEARYRDWPVWDFLPRFLELAEAHPDDPAAADALLWIVEKATAVGVMDREYYPTLKRALKLMEDHALYEDRRLFDGRLAVAIRYASPANERFLRAALEKARGRELRGQYGLALAQLLIERRGQARMFEADQPVKAPFQVFLQGRRIPEGVDYIRGTDRDAVAAEAEKLLDRTIAEFGDVAVKRRGRATTLAEVARGALKELHDLKAIEGGKAP